MEAKKTSSLRMIRCAVTGLEFRGGCVSKSASDHQKLRMTSGWQQGNNDLSLEITRNCIRATMNEQHSQQFGFSRKSRQACLDFWSISQNLKKNCCIISYPYQECLRVPGTIASPAFRVAIPFIFSHSGGYVVVSHGFNLLFLNDQWCWVLFLLLIGCLCSSFVKCMSESLAYFFFIEIFVFLLLGYQNSLYNPRCQSFVW